MTRWRDAGAVLLVVLALWQGAHLWVGEVGLASPAATFGRLWVLLGRAGFRADMAETAWAFAVSASLAVSGGVLIGCALGLSRLVGRVFEPLLSALYGLPKVTLYPVVLLLFGLGASARIAFGVMHGLIPVALVTMTAAMQVRVVHRRTARVLRLGRWQTLCHVVLPSIWPDVLGGIRIGVPLTLLGVLIGEMFASRRGLGSVAMRAMEANDGATLLAVAVLLSAAALLVNGGLGWVQRLFGGR